MGDLDHSPLFDSRHIEFIHALLRNHPMRPISAPEQRFLKQANIIRELNVYYDQGLIERLNFYKKRVAVEVAVEFLAEARRFDMLGEAVEVLDLCVRDDRGGTLQDLLTVLSESRTVPVGWAVLVYGAVEDERHGKKYEMPSGLNLEAMERFH